MSADAAPLVLDGSHGEGGGQILRTALFLSLLTGRSFQIDKIRQGRREPGLKPQHAGIIQLLSQMTGSRCPDATPGAPSVFFEPGRLAPGSYRYDIGTAGSIPLVLQTLLPTLLATPGTTEVDLVGGTDVLFGPTIDWVRLVEAPLLAPLAKTLEIDVLKRGFFPKGGGHVRVRTVTDPSSHSDFRAAVRARLGRPRLGWTGPSDVELVSVETAGLTGARVAVRQAEAATVVLAEAGLPVKARTETVDAFSPGSSLTIMARDASGNRIGADGLGARAITAETVGRETATRFLADHRSGAACDEHLADHWVLWAALGAGAMRVPRASPHVETNIWVCQAFLGADSVRLRDLVIECGAGVEPRPGYP